MFKVNGHYKTGIEISELFKDMGYKHGVDYIWSTDSPNNKVVFTVADPKVETFLALKLGARIV